MGNYIIDSATGNIIGYTGIFYKVANTLLKFINKKLYCNIQTQYGITNKKFVVGPYLKYSDTDILSMHIPDKYKNIHEVYEFLKLYESLVCKYINDNSITIHLYRYRKSIISGTYKTPVIIITQNIDGLENKYILELESCIGKYKQLDDKISYKYSIYTKNSMIVTSTGTISVNWSKSVQELLNKGMKFSRK